MKSPQFDYNKMTKAQLVTHCEAYSESIHQLTNQIQTYMLYESRRKELLSFWHGPKAGRA